MHALDLSIFHWLNDWCGTWALDRLAGFEEDSPLFRGGIFIILYWWFWFAGSGSRREANRRAILGALAGTLIALVINRALACGLPFRPRPMYVPEIGYHAPSIALKMNLEQWSAFPSDSATFFVGLGFGLWALSRWIGLLMTAYAVVWICLTRIYLGIHYPSDILAGALLGVAVVWATQAVVGWRGGKVGNTVLARLGRWERLNPPLFYASAFAVTFELSQVFDDVRDLAREGVRLLRDLGVLGGGQGTELFLAGAAAILLVAGGAVWGTILYHRRAQRRRLAGSAAPLGSAD